MDADSAAAAISAAMEWRSSPDARAAAFAYLESVRLLGLPPPYSPSPRPSPFSVWSRVCRRVGRFMSYCCFSGASVVARCCEL
jgi:hypothetical protein